MAQRYYGRTKNARVLPSEQKTWKEAAHRKLQQTGSIEQAEKYANHKNKAAIHRKMRKEKKGLLSG